MISIHLSVRENDRTGQSREEKKGKKGKRDLSPSLQVLYPSHSSLRICNHLREEISKARPTKLRIAAAVEVPVVDGLTIRGHTEAGRWLLRYALGLLLFSRTPKTACCVHARRRRHMGVSGRRRHQGGTRAEAFPPQPCRLEVCSLCGLER